MELVEDLKDEIINIINHNQEEKIIVFKKGFSENDLLVGGNGDESII